MSEPRATKVVWHDVSSAGLPPRHLRTRSDVLNNPPRQFLVRNDFQIDCAGLFESGGFQTPESFVGEVTAWALIEGF